MALRGGRRSFRLVCKFRSSFKLVHGFSLVVKETDSGRKDAASTPWPGAQLPPSSRRAASSSPSRRFQDETHAQAQFRSEPTAFTWLLTGSAKLSAHRARPLLLPHPPLLHFPPSPQATSVPTTMRLRLTPHQPSLFGFAALAALAGASHSAPARLAGGHLDKRCTGTISSLDDVAAAIKCTTVRCDYLHLSAPNLTARQINVDAFTVPKGETFDLSGLIKGTTINIRTGLLACTPPMHLTSSLRQWARSLSPPERTGRDRLRSVRRGVAVVHLR
mgnify:CR=1 FL=1